MTTKDLKATLFDECKGLSDELAKRVIDFFCFYPDTEPSAEFWIKVAGDITTNFADDVYIEIPIDLRAYANTVFEKGETGLTIRLTNDSRSNNKQIAFQFENSKEGINEQ